MKPDEKRISRQDSWVIGNDRVECAVTVRGGHMAPVTFARGEPNPIRPYYLSPWQDEELSVDEPVLKQLRGDFFCMPFGAAGTSGTETFVTHGETATGEWRFDRYEKHGTVTEFELSMRTTVRRGTVKKRILLVDGHDVLYLQHILEGYSGFMPIGHHATLAVPERRGDLLVSTAPYRFGMTDPDIPGYFKDGEYFSLPAGERFSDLHAVPTIWKEDPEDDCTSFPRRAGFTDILAVFSDMGTDPGWTAAVRRDEEFLWFSLKDPSVLPSTVFWMANRGRNGSPWLGRNRCLGLEDVCAYFASGMAASVRDNRISREGIPTALELKPEVPLAVNYIQGAVRIPGGFDRVKEARFSDGEVEFISESGKSVRTQVHHSFLRSGNPANP